MKKLLKLTPKVLEKHVLEIVVASIVSFIVFLIMVALLNFLCTVLEHGVLQKHLADTLMNNSFAITATGFVLCFIFLLWTDLATKILKKLTVIKP